MRQKPNVLFRVASCSPENVSKLVQEMLKQEFPAHQQVPNGMTNFGKALGAQISQSHFWEILFPNFPSSFPSSLG